MKLLNLISYGLNVILICYIISVSKNNTCEDVPAGTPSSQTPAESESEGFFDRLKYYLFDSSDTHETADSRPTLTKEEQERRKIEDIKTYIIDKEKARLPLTIQDYGKYDHVLSITIDSLVFIDNEMPYSGYFITTWTYDKSVVQYPMQKFVRKQKNIYVEVERIRYNYNDELEWYTQWSSALSVLD